MSGHVSNQQHETVLIPSMLTNSARAVLGAFGPQITQIKAHGSTETTNSSVIDELREYGVTLERQTLHRVKIDYKRLPGKDGPANQLTDDVIHRLFTELDAHLDTGDLAVAPDLAVTSLSVQVSDKQLQEVTPAQTDEFDLYFVADPAEEAVREQTELCNRERGLYRELGFNRTNLNLRRVVETATKHHEQGDGRYMSWQGPDDIRPRSPERLAVRINRRILPNDYRMLKPYSVTDDHVLEIREDELTTGDDGNQSSTQGDV